MPAPIAWNRKPLPENLLAPLPLTAVLPLSRLEAAVRSDGVRTLDDRLAKAYLLQDQEAVAAAGRDVEALLASSAAPSKQELRALMRCHAVTADKRIRLFLLSYAKKLYDTLPGSPLRDARQAADLSDLLHMALWLYNLTGQKPLLELCRMLKAQAPDWTSTFHIFPQTKPVKDAPDPSSDAYWRAHGETVAASLKTPALQALFEGGLKNETAFDVGYEKLMRHHGAAHGLWNANPLLCGASPSGFVAPGAVREAAHTLETLLWAQGNPAHADLLEKIVHNALPAARGPQAANQLAPAAGESAGGLSQFAASLWMASRDGGLAAVCYAPSLVRWRVHDQTVRIETETAYPFSEEIRLKVRVKRPAEFPLRLRIPGWAEGAYADVQGERVAATPGTFALLARLWRDGDEVALRLKMPVRAGRGYHQSVFVERGPLVYALPVLEGEAWNVALLPESGFELSDAAGIPAVHADAVIVPAWKRSGSVPAAPPVRPEVHGADKRRVTLLPYGQTEARIAQFPEGLRKGTEA